MPRPSRLLFAFVLTLAVGCTIYNSSLLGGGGGGGDGGEGGCQAGASVCTDNTVSQCVGGKWVVEEVCPKGCADGGACIENPSCQGGGPGADQSCGPTSTTDCCAALPVPGGTYERSLDAGAATVSAFILDEFEVTVGRYRKFVTAGYGTRETAPAEDAGANPLASGSGWSSSWDNFLPKTTEDLEASFTCEIEPTWTSSSGDNENLPMNCLTWYEAFAFCVWDGGRLPSEAEWNFAAAAGSDNRYYPWSNPPNSQEITPDYAAYECTAHDKGNPVFGDAQADGAMGPLLCLLSDIVPVGSLPMGNGKYGHADLAGNVAEWTTDWFLVPYPTPCDNCEALDAAGSEGGPYRVFRGGGYYYDPEYVTTASRDIDLPSNRDDSYGVRCARYMTP